MLATPAVSLAALGLLLTLTGCSVPSPSDASPQVRSRHPEGNGTSDASASARIELLAIELQPEDPMPGGQEAVVRNAGTQAAELGCWELRSERHGVAGTIEEGVVLPAGAAVRLTPDDGWLASPDRVSLADRSGTVIDRTPLIRDDAFDDRVWFRDGADWRFGRIELPGEVIDARLTIDGSAPC
jgi:hypothetical protein